MGKYAQFNTGFEYNFTFGVQSSLDVTLFGGIGEIDHDHLKGVWRWKTNDDIFNFDDDAIVILKRLKDFEEKGYVIPKFHNYDKTVEGTHDMYVNEKFGKDTITKMDMGDLGEFRIGCLIYHQLLYQPNLSVAFDI